MGCVWSPARARSNCVDYVTEKLWRAFRMGVVPVYLGAPNLGDFEPLPGSVIKVSDFRSMRVRLLS